MISRRTLYSFLCACLVGMALIVWRVSHHDGCERGASGTFVRPQNTIVETGTRTVVMPCDEWIPRQPLVVQAACLLELALLVMFALFFFVDRRAVGRERAGLAATRRAPRS